MGSNGSKPAATGDMRYMEIYSHGSTSYCSKWYKLYGFRGKLEKTAVRELSDKLRAATAGTTQGKKRKKLEAQLRVAALWAEQAHKRTGEAEEGMIAAAVSVKADEETGRSGSVDAVRREKERAIVEEHKAQEQRIKRKQEKERKDRERETQKRIDIEMADALSPLHTRKNKGETKLYPVEELREAEQSFDGTAYQGDAYPLVHAATQIKEKRHKKASASAFFIGEDGEENQIFFVGPGQGRGGFNRGRGNDRGTGRGRGGGRNTEGKFLCYRCGKEGHMARDCEEQRPQNKEGGQKGQYKDERHGPPPSHNLHSYDN
ncbi:uncharacterized protein LOC117541813 [Gymnodraco acuticeps]|uniref:Uncharacterized protein LOC117541813 n=1 Tax=Gymnodraco acuticeps TaxID=8218 RepID=A0A6P8TLC7_GYMAC|nr:uncharacterized protein LOC117541813 [Gymnodraco acuticeps]